MNTAIISTVCNANVSMNSTIASANPVAACLSLPPTSQLLYALLASPKLTQRHYILPHLNYIERVVFLGGGGEMLGFSAS